MEVVDHRMSGPATAEDQEALRVQRAVLADPAEVRSGQAGHGVSYEPLAAAVGFLTRDRVEGIEGGRLVVIGRRDDRASCPGAPVTVPEPAERRILVARRIGLEDRLGVVDVVVPPG